MKVQKKKRILCIAAVISLLFTTSVWGTVGSDDDPLISLSYITNVMIPYIDNAVSQIQTAPESEYIVEQLDAGDVLIAGASCDIILRSGDAIVKLDEGAQGGFTDVTEGRDVFAEETISANHHLICPRSDGRKVLAQTEVYIMVRGAYSVQRGQ